MDRSLSFHTRVGENGDRTFQLRLIDGEREVLQRPVASMLLAGVLTAVVTGLMPVGP